MHNLHSSLRRRSPIDLPPIPAELPSPIRSDGESARSGRGSRRRASTSVEQHLLPHDPLPRLRPQASLPHATLTLSRHASLPRRLSRADGARAAVADPVAAAEPVDEEKEKEEETEAAEDEEDTLLDRAQPDLTGPFAHVQFVNGPMPNLPKVDVSLDPVKELSRVISERKN
ncbi:hypothetical protein ACQJBY_054195 [Aegilops geniculata]